jgi:hypothetical protein
VDAVAHRDIEDAFALRLAPCPMTTTERIDAR